MILAWMVSVTAFAALFAGAAFCAEQVAASRQRPRRLVWVVAIVGSALAAVVAPRVVAPPVQATNVAAPANTAVAEQPVSAGLGDRLGDMDIVALVMWAAASLTFAAFLFVAHRRIVRALRDFEPAIVAGHDVLVSHDFGPATVGVFRRRVVVPSWILTLPGDEQRLIVAHELEHARSGDPLVILGGVFAAVMMPWNAPLWWQLARLRLAVEVDCDARVVRGAGGGMLAYGQLLLRVGERAQSTRRPALALAHARSSLGKRFDALLGRDHGGPGRAFVATVAGAGLVASVAFVPGPRASDIVGGLRLARATIAPRAPAPAPARQNAAVPIIVTGVAAAAPAPSRRAALSVGRPSGSLKARLVLEATPLPSVTVIPAKPVLDLAAIQRGVRAAPLSTARRGGGGVFATAGARDTSAAGLIARSGQRGGGGGGSGGTGGAVAGARDRISGAGAAAGGIAPTPTRPDTTRPPQPQQP